MLVCLDEDTRRHAILRQIKHKFYICSLASPVNLCFRHNEEALPKKSLINPNSLSSSAYYLGTKDNKVCQYYKA